MNLLEIAHKNGRSYKRAGNLHGGEFHGPCPVCGGTDRFHIWPHQGEHGTFWCRGCSLGGDAIEYLMKIENLSFPQACKEIGKELPESEDYQKPKIRSSVPSQQDYEPRSCSGPEEQWVEHATKLIDWAHSQLLENEQQIAWLADRGIAIDTIVKLRLGWNPGEKGKDLYRSREAWGLETVIKEDGKKKKLWLPIGLTIPYIVDGTVQRVRIRRPEGEPRYYVLPGSSMAPMILGIQSKAFVIVESELDAILLHQLAGDLTGIISQGNASARPDTSSASRLAESLAILIALDSDQAGMKETLWWKKQYPQAERWPVPTGKDPGEAFKAGIDLRQWIKAGLPPVLTMPEPPVKSQKHAASQDNTGQTASITSPETEQDATVHTITAKDGRTVHITDDRSAYAELAAAGKIVFDSKEIAFVKLSGADQDQAARFLDIKQIFPGTRIESVGPDVTAPQQRKNRYHGKCQR